MTGIMSGFYRYEYHWCDGVNYKKPTALPAPQYISLLMEWVEAQINDENIFPVKVGKFCIWVSLLKCPFFFNQKKDVVFYFKDIWLSVWVLSALYIVAFYIKVSFKTRLKIFNVILPSSNCAQFSGLSQRNYTY